MIKVSKIEHRNETRILFTFGINEEIKSKIKSLPSVSYTSTYKGWYVDYNKDNWARFLKLGLEYEIEKVNESSITIDKNDNYIYPNRVEKESIEKKVLINANIDQSGTASSPKSSDIAGIGTANNTVSQVVHPSNGDSKGTDIHLNKGGRSIHCNNGNFFLTINYNQEDITFLKSLKGYWQSKIKKWIVKATMDNFEKLQLRYDFWNDEALQKIKDLILYVEYPYLLTLYRTAEDMSSVTVQITGYKSNTNIIKQTSERQYQKDEKRWLIPNDKVIIEQLKKDYTRDGATIIDRLPQEGFDYHKKEESYGDYKARFLSKTEENLKNIVERYLDSLIAFKRSQRTMTTYLGPFIKFVKYIGVEKIDEIASKEIDKYMSLIGSQKVSDGFLHNAFNAIMFYYRDVLRKNERLVNEAKRPKKADTLPTILSSGEVDRILRALSNLKHTTILFTFYGSGMRLNEILHLRVEDIWWERNQIMVKGGKGKKDRVVPLAQVLKELLKLYFDEYKPIYWLFEGQDRKLPYSDRSIQNVVIKAVKEAKINKRATAHTIRHCYATHLLDGGTELRYIQELLGHVDIKTTLIYTHVTNHSLSKIQSPLDKLMGFQLEKINQKFGKSESSD